MNGLLKLDHVRKTFYSDGKPFDAVKDVSLEIQKGEIFGIIGLSGAGKSTLIRCMNRLETPTSGDILIDGESILKMNGKQLRQLRKKVTMIFQQFNLLMQKTVARNVRYPLAQRPTSASGSCSRSSDSPTRPITIPPSSPAVRSSASPSPAPSPATPRCCSATRPPAPSTP